MYKTFKKYFRSTISSSRLKGLLISYISMCFLEKLAFCCFPTWNSYKNMLQKYFLGVLYIPKSRLFLRFLSYFSINSLIIVQIWINTQQNQHRLKKVMRLRLGFLSGVAKAKAKTKAEANAREKRKRRRKEAENVKHQLVIFCIIDVSRWCRGKARWSYREGGQRTVTSSTFVSMRKHKNSFISFQFTHCIGQRTTAQGKESEASWSSSFTRKTGLGTDH